MHMLPSLAVGHPLTSKHFAAATLTASTLEDDSLLLAIESLTTFLNPYVKDTRRKEKAEGELANGTHYGAPRFTHLES